MLALARVSILYGGIRTAPTFLRTSYLELVWDYFRSSKRMKSSLPRIAEVSRVGVRQIASDPFCVGPVQNYRRWLIDCEQKRNAFF